MAKNGYGDSKFDCMSVINEQMQQTDFLHVNANSGKLKVITMIFGWALSKMGVVI